MSKKAQCTGLTAVLSRMLIIVKRSFFQGVTYSYEYVPDATKISPDLSIVKSMITKQFANSLKTKDYRFKGHYRAYKIENMIQHPNMDLFHIFNGFEFRTVIHEDKILLCIDPHLIIKVTCSIETLLNFGISEHQLNDFTVFYFKEGESRPNIAYLLETLVREAGVCRVKDYRDSTEYLVSSINVFPKARPELLQDFLSKLDRHFDVINLQRKHSFLDSQTASRDRLLKTLEIVRELKADVFPLRFGEFEVGLETEPIVVRF